MEFIETLQQMPWLFYSYVLVVGLLVGSFLNVVIYRTPIMMEREFLSECRNALDIKDEQASTDSEPFNLVVPRSHCPSCKALIKAWQNIPIISYLVQKGRCANCGSKIPLRYPIIEAVTGLISILVALRFGVTIQCVMGLLLCWALIALTIIDYDHYLLPDSITLPFLWLGVLASIYSVFVPLQNSVIGVVAGYLSLWSVYWIFKLLTKKEGMGYGDFKLLAMLGAWLGWKMLPIIIILSSFVGAVVGISLIIFGGRDRNKHIPFGPYLAGAGFLTLFWGEDLFNYYLKFSGLA